MSMEYAEFEMGMLCGGHVDSLKTTSVGVRDRENVRVKEEHLQICTPGVSIWPRNMTRENGEAPGQGPDLGGYWSNVVKK